MGFLMQCSNKGCCKHQEPMLDLESGEVYCSECNNIMNNVTEFAKRQMQSLGQIRRDAKRQQAFSVKCQACNKQTGPKILSDNTIVCALCEETLELTKPFEQVIRSHFKAQRKDPQ